MIKTRILIAEDDFESAQVIHSKLGKMGYEVIAVIDQGNQVITQIKLQKPDLILLDMDLNGHMAGVRVAQEILNQIGTPIIFLTEHTMENILDSVRLPGTFTTIQKPFQDHELRTTIDVALFKSEMEKKLLQQQKYFRALIERSNDVIVIIDGEGAIQFVSPSIESLLSARPEDFIGHNILDFFHPLDAKKVKEDVLLARPVEDKLSKSRYRISLSNNDWRMIEVQSRNYLDDPDLNGIVLNIRDINEKVASEEALKLERDRAQKSEERYMLALQGANDGIWDWDIKSDVFYTSPRWKAMIGFGETEIENHIDEWFNRVHSIDLERLKFELFDHLKGEGPHLEFEHRILHRDGDWRWVLARGLAVRDEQGIAYRIAGSLTDVTARKQAEERLTYNAMHDVLTGLPNRALLFDRLDLAIRRLKRDPTATFSVLFLDLDRFKIVNDSLGHTYGDKLLIAFSQLLQRLVRATDTVSRIGGDEFVVLLEDSCGLDESLRIADRILQSLETPITSDGQKYYTSASIGIVTSLPEHQTPEDVLRDVDIALYTAKAQGKARYAVFNATLREQAVTYLELESDIHRALENKELQVYYQPIINLETDRLVGFEALLRWFHPRRGMIMPLEFIRLAEETGIIIAIGQWVLEEACTQLHKWQLGHQDVASLFISVNVSSKQLINSQLVTHIRDALAKSGLSPKNLRLEITETVFLSNPDLALSILNELSELGVRLYIDDFGIGYSALSYLQSLPVDTLKIDRIFISNINNQTSNSDLVASIIRLAADLGVSVIAEGVENQEQQEYLRNLKCGYAQGFLFSKPLPSHSAELWLDRAA